MRCPGAAGRQKALVMTGKLIARCRAAANALQVRLLGPRPAGTGAVGWDEWELLGPGSELEREDGYSKQGCTPVRL